MEVISAKQINALNKTGYDASRAYDSSSLSQPPSSAQSKPGSVSERLDDKQVREAIAAADFALADLPLNRFLTINWERACVEDAAAATRAFLKYAADFCRHHNRPFAYLWVIEPSPKVGIHAHILMRLDHDIGTRFAQLQRGWVKRVGGRSEKGNIKTRHVGASRTAYLRRDRDDGFYAKNQRWVVEYILKYCSFEIARDLGFKRHVRSGPVKGQRFGCSHHLGPQARREAQTDPNRT